MPFVRRRMREPRSRPPRALEARPPTAGGRSRRPAPRASRRGRCECGPDPGRGAARRPHDLLHLSVVERAGAVPTATARSPGRAAPEDSRSSSSSPAPRRSSARSRARAQRAIGGTRVPLASRPGVPVVEREADPHLVGRATSHGRSDQERERPDQVRRQRLRVSRSRRTRARDRRRTARTGVPEAAVDQLR